MRNRPCLTTEDARRVMDACLREAAKNNWRAAIVIVDEGGALLMAERHVGAAPIAVEAALRKARTSAVTRRPTLFWEERVKERAGFLTFPAEMMMLQGGLPLMHEGECVGAIGVSGVQSKEDEQIARAGVDALAREQP